MTAADHLRSAARHVLQAEMATTDERQRQAISLVATALDRARGLIGNGEGAGACTPGPRRRWR